MWEALERSTWDHFMAFLIAHPILATIVGATILISLLLFRWNYLNNVFKDALRYILRKPKPPEQDATSFIKKSP